MNPLEEFETIHSDAANSFENHTDFREISFTAVAKWFERASSTDPLLRTFDALSVMDVFEDWATRPFTDPAEVPSLFRA